VIEKPNVSGIFHVCREFSRHRDVSTMAWEGWLPPMIPMRFMARFPLMIPKPICPSMTR